MKILFDHNLPRRLREHLPGHEIRTTREMKWEQLRNGALMSVAAATGFEVFVTIDKQIEHQQNLATLARPCSCLSPRSYVTCSDLHFNATSTSSRKAEMFFS